LLLEVAFLQRHDKPYEADRVKGEADDPVVRSERKKIGICKDNMLEVIDDTLAIQEVVCCGKEVPIQGLAPRIFTPIFNGLRVHQRKQPGYFTIHNGLADENKNDQANGAHE